MSFDPQAEPQNGEVVWFQLDWGNSEGWWLPATSGEGKRPLVIAAHGQRGLIDHWEQRLNGLRDLGCHCLLVEFPGYGRSAGIPSEQSFSETFCAAYDWARQRNDVDGAQIIGLGRSMGGGVISLLAEQRPLAGLWLMSTFTSLRPFIQRRLIPAWLLKDPLDTLQRLRCYQRPVVLIHGTEDEVIPYHHSERLAKMAPHAKLLLERSGHDSCPLDWEAFWGQALEFTREHTH